MELILLCLRLYGLSMLAGRLGVHELQSVCCKVAAGARQYKHVSIPSRYHRPRDMEAANLTASFYTNQQGLKCTCKRLCM